MKDIRNFEPRPGMVICYNYLWARQHSLWDRAPDERTGVPEKYRPCAILGVSHEDGETTVYVSPITHTAPYNPRAGIMLPRATRERLGRAFRGDEPSWLMCSEVNVFTWPGFDLGTASGSHPRSCLYGSLPRAMLEQARGRLAEFNAQHRLKLVPRDVSASPGSP